MKKMVEIAHDLITSYAKMLDVCADFTMGQGYDTLFLANHAKKVYAFDIQQCCLDMTKERLRQAGVVDKAVLILDSHERAPDYIQERLDVGIFNFGYLPGSDKMITTHVESSAKAVDNALKLIKKHGILALVIYTGHFEGKKESTYFDTWAASLPKQYFQVLRLQMENRKDAPYILLIEKIREVVQNDKGSDI